MTQQKPGSYNIQLLETKLLPHLRKLVEQAEQQLAALKAKAAQKEKPTPPTEENG